MDYSIRGALFGSRYIIRRLRTSTRVVMQQCTNSRYCCFSSNSLLQKLHWLPIYCCIQFKLATLTHRALLTGRPSYLADLLQYHKPTKSTRSSSTQLLFVPRHNLSFGSRAFRISAPKLWNSLPPDIRKIESPTTFRRHLKTHFFQSAYSSP